MKFLNPLLFLAIVPSYAGEFHVSPDGNDSAPGTKSQPVATLERARDMARMADGGEDIRIILHDGIWRLEKTFELDARDSGKNGHMMIYAAAPGAKPVLSGSRVVSGWKPAPAHPGIYQAPAGKAAIRQCYVDGAWAQRARGPYFKLTDFTDKNGTYTISSENWPPAFSKGAPKDLELAVCVHWRHLLVHCHSFEAGPNGSAIVAPTEEQKKRSTKPASPVKGDTAHFQNALALIDEPGEWYHDRETGMLYYKPLPHQDIHQARIEIPTLETLVSIKGDAKTPVHHIGFRGITLEGTAWTFPSIHGLYATQFAQPYDKVVVPGALMAAHTSGFSFTGGVARCMGGGALHLQNAMSAEISNNRLHDIGCNAIDGRDAIVSMSIHDNDITRCGRDISNGGAIILRSPTREARIEHNHIHDLPYSGMQIGDQPGGYRDTGTHDNKIRFNHVHHCMKLHDDGGGIYTLGGQQKGTEIAYNFVHDIRRSRWAGDWPVNGVYLDNYTQFVHVHHNVIRDCTVDAKEQNRSKDNIIENNVPKDAEIERNAGVRAADKSGS